jgi:hypothetical protein
MGGIYIKIKWVGPVVLCTTGIAMSAWSAPPFAKAVSAAQPTERSARADSRGHLDLRAPVPHEFAGTQSQRYSTEDKTGEDARLSGLGIAMSQNRGSNRPEAMVQRFHREGLPVTRLWEGHSGFLSLGLNPKGKPGLWLVQKTH